MALRKKTRAVGWVLWGVWQILGESKLYTSIVKGILIRMWKATGIDWLSQLSMSWDRDRNPQGMMEPPSGGWPMFGGTSPGQREGMG